MDFCLSLVLGLQVYGTYLVSICGQVDDTKGPEVTLLACAEIHSSWKQLADFTSSVHSVQLH